MIQRLTIGLLVLMFADSAFAQAPDEVGPVSPPVPAARDQGPLSALMVMPSGWAMPSSEGRFWVSTDSLFAFVRGAHLPALVTTSDAGTAQINAGVLGAPGSRTLFGDAWVNDELRSGFRLGTGYWFHEESKLGIESGFMILEGKAAHFAATSDTFPILGRPFQNAVGGVQGSQLIAFPGASTGSVDARANSGNFYEAHIDLTEKAYEEGWFRLTSMLGYRFYRYDESVHLKQVLNPTSANFIAGTQIATSDNFTTGNTFHGLDMGFRSQFLWDTLSLDVLTKLAVGKVFRTININGDQTITAPGAAAVTQGGGVLALGTNSGLVSSHDWKCVPEVGATLSWQVRSHLSLRLGYSFVFLNGVVRAADQIDTTINPNLLPGANAALGGPARPAALNTRSDMWIQSINVGLQWTY